MKLAFTIAYRFLKSSKVQTSFIILGIAVGVSVQVFIGLLISGLQNSLINKTVGNSAQIVLTDKDQYIHDYDFLLNDLKRIDQRITSILPTLNLNANAYHEQDTAPLLIRSFDLSKVDTIYKLSSKLETGNLPTGENEIILGKFFKNELKIDIGSSVIVRLPDNREYTLTVVDFFDFKVKSINEAWAIVSLETGQHMANQNVLSSIEIQINSGDVFDAREISNQISTQYTQFNVENWMDNNEELLSGLQGQSTSSLMIQIFVLISVVIGIASVLAITVMQKSKQIGILKAMGIKDLDASLIFIIEGFLLGILGALFGVLFGLGLIYSFTIFAVNSDGSPVVPIYIEGKFIILSATIAVVASMLAALIPARKSSKLTVIEVIRNG